MIGLEQECQKVVEQIRDWAFDKLKSQGDKWTDRKKEGREPF